MFRTMIGGMEVCRGNFAAKKTATDIFPFLEYDFLEIPSRRRERTYGPIEGRVDIKEGKGSV